jgi:hypothetical protein
VKSDVLGASWKGGAMGGAAVGSEHQRSTSVVFVVVFVGSMVAIEPLAMLFSVDLKAQNETSRTRSAEGVSEHNPGQLPVNSEGTCQ